VYEYVFKTFIAAVGKGPLAKEGTFPRINGGVADDDLLPVSAS